LRNDRKPVGLREEKKERVQQGNPHEDLGDAHGSVEPHIERGGGPLCRKGCSKIENVSAGTHETGEGGEKELFALNGKLISVFGPQGIKRIPFGRHARVRAKPKEDPQRGGRGKLLRGKRSQLGGGYGPKKEEDIRAAKVSKKDWGHPRDFNSKQNRGWRARPREVWKEKPVP